MLKWRFIACAAVAATFSALVPTGAMAASVQPSNVNSAAPTTKAGALLKGDVLTLPDGSKVKLPKNWSEMTLQDLASLGIKPGMQPAAQKGTLSPSSESAPSATATAAGKGVTPYSATGWNDSVFISITGTKWLVDKWYTTASDFWPTCTFAVYWWTQSEIWATSNQVCSGYDAAYYSQWPYGFSTLQNVWLCNSWATINGKPCLYVHN